MANPLVVTFLLLLASLGIAVTPKAVAAQDRLVPFEFPSRAAAVAVSVVHDVRPENSTSSASYDIYFSLLEQRSLAFGAPGANNNFNVALVQFDEHNNVLGDGACFRSAYQPPAWLRNETDGSYSAVFHGAQCNDPTGSQWIGDATVIACPPGGESLKQTFSVSVLRGGLYRSYRIYYHSDVFCH